MWIALISAAVVFAGLAQCSSPQGLPYVVDMFDVIQENRKAVTHRAENVPLDEVLMQAIQPSAMAVNPLTRKILLEFGLDLENSTAEVYSSRNNWHHVLAVTWPNTVASEAKKGDYLKARLTPDSGIHQPLFPIVSENYMEYLIPREETQLSKLLVELQCEPMSDECFEHLQNANPVLVVYTGVKHMFWKKPAVSREKRAFTVENFKAMQKMMDYRSPDHCQTREKVISFSEVGFTLGVHTILRPEKINFRFCGGYCPHPLPVLWGVFNVSNHGTVMDAWFGSKGADKKPEWEAAKELGCIPKEYQSLEVLRSDNKVVQIAAFMPTWCKCG